MPSYSQNSRDNLDTAHHGLQRLFNLVVYWYDNTIIQGWRSLVEQQQQYETGASKVRQGKHNTSPSLAVDSAPYIAGRGIPWPQVPRDWRDKGQRDKYIKDLCQFYHYAGFVQGVAKCEGVEIRWGGDWDRDNDIADQSFDDLVHFELTGETYELDEV